MLGVRARNWLTVALSGAAICACSTSREPDPGRKTGSLIDHNAWVTLEAADDPFAAERPAEIVCPADKARAQNVGGADLFEVDTSGCNYVSISQPSLLPVKKGDTIYIEGWRGATPNRAPAEAHVGITLNGKVLFDMRYPIPWPCGRTLCKLACDNDGGPGSDAQDPTEPPCDKGIQPFVVVEEDAPQGSTIVYHVHNHGDNKYDLIKMELQ